MDSAQTRSGYRKWWTAHSRDLLVVGEMILKLRNQGWEVAAGELERVFANKEWLYAEAVPADKIVLHTVCVPKFKDLLRFFRWFAYSRTKEEAQMRWGRYNDYQLPDQFQGLLPSFQESIKVTEARRRDLNDVFVDALGEDVLKPSLEPLKKIPCRDGDQVFLRFDWHTMPFWTCQHLYQNDWGLARLVEGIPSEISGKYYKDSGDVPTMWQLGIPVGYWSERETRIGFHPQADHDRWAHREGVFTSPDCHDGYGLAMFRSETPSAEEYIRYYQPESIREEQPTLPSDAPFTWVLQQRENRW